MMLDKDNVRSTASVVDCLCNGGVAVLPTDTVYGFSGIVDVAGAKERYKTDVHIRAIKGRAETKPLIELISRPEDILSYTNDKIPQSLLDKWPGPLTIIVHIKEGSPLADNPQTVAFRCPGDAWLREVIGQCGAPLFSTSVNRSGSPVLDEIESIEHEFGKEVDLIVADGDKKGALPSTIVSIDQGKITVLRQGAVTV